MPAGLTDPLTAAFAAMSLEQLCESHRDLLLKLRDVDHWRRLTAARLDLAVASVAGMEEPVPDPGLSPISCATPPDGLSRLLGIAQCEERLGETALLPRLRQALDDLDLYERELRVLADEAGSALAARSFAGPCGETPPEELAG